MSLTQEQLKACLHYEAETGVFTRISARKFLARYVGKPAGSVSKVSGYVQIHVLGKLYSAHRLAFLYMTGKWPQLLVDHIDRNRANNSWANLREANYVLNGQNVVHARADSLTGLRGVSKCAKSNTYFARITADKRPVYLGCFPSAEAASQAYQRAKRQLHIQVTS